MTNRELKIAIDLKKSSLSYKAISDKTSIPIGTSADNSLYQICLYYYVLQEAIKCSFFSTSKYGRMYVIMKIANYHIRCS